MDELGREKVAVISRLDDSQDKWREIVGTARSYGFSGIQMTPSLYEEQLGLDLLDIPAFLKQLRLTYHIGGTYSLVTPGHSVQLWPPAVKTCRCTRPS